MTKTYRETKDYDCGIFGECPSKNILKTALFLKQSPKLLSLGWSSSTKKNELELDHDIII